MYMTSHIIYISRWTHRCLKMISKVSTQLFRCSLYYQCWWWDSFQEILEGQNTKIWKTQRRNILSTSYYEQLITYSLKKYPKRMTIFLNLTKWKYLLLLESHCKKFFSMCVSKCVHMHVHFHTVTSNVSFTGVPFISLSPIMTWTCELGISIQ